MWLFALFIVIPIIEIALFIQVGGLIGLWPTIGLVLLTAIAGSYLVRVQGLGALSDLQRSVRDLRDPTEPFAHGILILFAGLLLLTPGFFTDAIGIALLIRPVRSLLLSRLTRGIQITGVMNDMQGNRPYDRRPAGPDILDGEFHEISPEDRRNPPSGWTRH